MHSVYEDMRESEKEVARYLKHLGLKWIYEFPVFIFDEKDRPRVWSPDFYIPKFGMYIEVCGSKDFDYTYRDRIYKDNGYNVIFVHLFKEPEKWKNFLVKRIIEIEELRHDDIMKVVSSLLGNNPSYA